MLQVQGRLPLSVSIIACNEEKIIGRMLDSVKPVASEIVVVIDADCNDSTAAIAESYGAKVYIEEWKGFTDQKNSSLEKCSYEWILFLDADEVLTPELRESITYTILNPKDDTGAYYLDRRTHYLGKLLNYAWRPDFNLRLARRDAKPRWSGGIVHESLQIEGKKERLEGILIHYSYRDIKHHFTKTIDYARTCAKSYYSRGKRFSLLNLVINPIFAFIKQYFIHKGFMDGFRGLLAAFSSMVYTFLKYSFLWELQFNRKQNDK